MQGTGKPNATMHLCHTLLCNHPFQDLCTREMNTYCHTDKDTTGLTALFYLNLFIELTGKNSVLQQTNIFQ